MTFTEIANRINEMKSVAHDPEVARSIEFDLWRDFIRSVRAECPGELAEKAEMVLSTEQIPLAH